MLWKINQENGEQNDFPPFYHSAPNQKQNFFQSRNRFQFVIKKAFHCMRVFTERKKIIIKRK